MGGARPGQRCTLAVVGVVGHGGTHTGGTHALRDGALDQLDPEPAPLCESDQLRHHLVRVGGRDGLTDGAAQREAILGEELRTRTGPRWVPAAGATKAHAR